MSHSRQDQLWLQPAHQAQQRNGRGAHSRNTQRVNPNPGRNLIRRDRQFGDEAQMKLVFLRRKPAGEEGNHTLSPTATKVRDQ